MSAHTLPVTLKLTHKRGLDPKVASELAMVATHFDCDRVTLTWQGRSVDVKSIVALLSLELAQGEKIRLHAEGLQAQEALDALIEVIQRES
jgi:phosphocarrier protein HPr